MITTFHYCSIKTKRINSARISKKNDKGLNETTAECINARTKALLDLFNKISSFIMLLIVLVPDFKPILITIGGSVSNGYGVMLSENIKAKHNNSFRITFYEKHCVDFYKR